MTKEKIAVFWFRRDLRLEDNIGLYAALKGDFPVLPLFIFDQEIINELDKDDARITFIHDCLTKIAHTLSKKSHSIYGIKGKPEEVWVDLLDQFDIQAVYTNEDYEPYAIKRDQTINDLLGKKKIPFYLYKDQVIFAKKEIVKADQTPYTVYTPYKNKWLLKYKETTINQYDSHTISNFHNSNFQLPSLSDLGFERSNIKIIDYTLKGIADYENIRNFPALNLTSYLSPHLRFGTVSVRQAVTIAKQNATFLNELIWREFFMQILYHFPKVLDSNFKSKYDGIKWRNNLEEFEKWKKGETGYPMVDAGMRELNTTGYMHNRVRMVVAGFLCKHLLIDWKWGEAYFAEKLLDYDLSANNGNWQWAAGTGCDSAPYFRIFNPTEQIKKFDKQLLYIKKWIPELDSLEYPTPMVDHKFARERALETYKKGLKVIL